MSRAPLRVGDLISGRYAPDDVLLFERIVPGEGTAHLDGVVGRFSAAVVFLVLSVCHIDTGEPALFLLASQGCTGKVGYAWAGVFRRVQARWER